MPKKVGVLEKRKLVTPGQEEMTIAQQLKTLGLSKSTYYYSARPLSDFNLDLMRRIDEIYTESPEYGSRTIKTILQKEYGRKRINRKRIQRLMRIMGIQTVYPKRNLSKPGKGSEHKIYPYLLRKRNISSVNEVWCSDITYIRLDHVFVYLVAVMDWHTRKILSWELSTTMDSSFCISALERAMRLYGKPEIFNTDQGSQFTCKGFQDILRDTNVKISMNGKGRALDNIVIERFWRTLKYGDI